MHTTFNFLIYKKKNTKLIRIRYYYSTVKLLYILYEKKSMMKLMVVILAIYLLVIPTFGFKTPKNKHCEMCLSTHYGNANTCAPFCKGGFDEIGNDNYEIAMMMILEMMTMMMLVILILHTTNKSGMTIDFIII